jgi:hypothetical protein
MCIQSIKDTEMYITSYGLYKKWRKVKELVIKNTKYFRIGFE